MITNIAEVGCCERTIQRYRKSFNTHGIDGLADGREMNGPARKTTPRQDDALVEAMEGDRFNAATQVLQEVDPNLSQSTMRRRMKEDGLMNGVAAVKTLLEERHKETRMTFARSVEHLTAEDWRTVIFTDEKVFSTDKDCRRTVWRRRGERYHPDNILPKHRSGRVTAAFWGWMSAAGPGELVEIDRRMNSELYIEILEEVMIPSVRAVYPVEVVPIIRVVEDNSAVHRARIVRDWYDDHPEVERFNWPAKSPDLNVIENFWSKMGEGWTPVARERREGLCRRVHAAWEELREKPEYSLALVNSMPRRIQKVLDEEGRPIPY